MGRAQRNQATRALGLIVLFMAGLSGRSASAASPSVSTTPFFSVGDVDAETASIKMRQPGVPTGAFPVQIELTNHAKAERHVALQFSSGPMGVGALFGGSGGAERRVVLAPAEVRTVVLPVAGGNYGSVIVKVAETKAEATSPMMMMGMGNNSTSATLVIGDRADLKKFYEGIDLPAPAPEDDEKTYRAKPYAPSAETLPDPNRDALCVSSRAAPDLLAGYTGFGAVIVPAASLSSLSTPQRVALEDYLLLGGELFLGPEALSAPLQLDQWRGGGGKEERLGLGVVRACRKKEDCESALRDIYRPSVVVPRASGNSGYAGRNPYMTDKIDLHSRMLKKVGRVPLDAFLFIILAFSIAIGPGSLFIARRRGRHFLLITIPSVALVTCGGITAYGAAADGLFTIHAESQSVTFLDDASHRAATLAVTAYFSSLKQGRMTFPGEVADTFDISHGSLGVDWTDGMELTGDVLPARTYTERATLSVSPSRARLIVSGSEVRNALGGHVVGGYVNRHGTVFKLPVLDPEGHGELAPIELTQTNAETAHIRSLAEPIDQHFDDHILAGLAAPLGEDEFVAVLSDGDFVPNGGLKLTWHPSLNFVRGKVAP